VSWAGSGSGDRSVPGQGSRHEAASTGADGDLTLLARAAQVGHTAIADPSEPGSETVRVPTHFDSLMPRHLLQGVVPTTVLASPVTPLDSIKADEITRIHLHVLSRCCDLLLIFFVETVRARNDQTARITIAVVRVRCGTRRHPSFTPPSSFRRARIPRAKRPIFKCAQWCDSCSTERSAWGRRSHQLGRRTGATQCLGRVS
jgi:hypothetical protein